MCDAVADPDPESAVPSPQFQLYVVIVPMLSVEPAALTASVVPACPAYGPPALAVGPTTKGIDVVSPSALYALTATRCRPLVNGNAIVHPHGPPVGCGVIP